MSPDAAPSESGDSAPKLLVIVGPTASGKTALAIRLADELGGEIISADSVQIYRYFDIGSGKPTAEEKAGIVHHLIDELEPTLEWDAAQFQAIADARIEAVRARGKIPIVCGGTFLWVRALLYGLAKAPPSEPEIRARHEAIAARDGRAALHAELSRVDPPLAEKLNPNDFVRVSRALEVFELCGRPLSAIQAEHGFRTLRHRASLVGIAQERETLNERIAERARAMLSLGLVDEVRALLERGYRDSRAMNSVGYRQVRDAIDAGTERQDTLFESIAQATRVFARRQRTWLRDQAVHWIPADRAKSLRAADLEFDYEALNSQA
jgi:tRNA dimethylallyltransferase